VQVVAAPDPDVIVAFSAAADVEAGKRRRRRLSRRGNCDRHGSGWMMKPSRAIDPDSGLGDGPLLRLAADLEDLDDDHAPAAARTRHGVRIRGGSGRRRLLAHLLCRARQMVKPRLLSSLLQKTSVRRRSKPAHCVEARRCSSS
jgi:hypothetical protein